MQWACTVCERSENDHEHESLQNGCRVFVMPSLEEKLEQLLQEVTDLQDLVRPEETE